MQVAQVAWPANLSMTWKANSNLVKHGTSDGECEVISSNKIPSEANESRLSKMGTAASRVTFYLTPLTLRIISVPRTK